MGLGVDMPSPEEVVPATVEKVVELEAAVDDTVLVS
jgi:hypothetical protein